MKAKWIKRLPCLLLCLGLATAAIAQSDTPSVLDLVQNVDDPELGELIRVAIESQAKFRGLTQEDTLAQEETLELTHKVTLSYTQIKLFNQQIQEVSRKIGATTGPVEMRYSLLLAKTELEAKRMTEVANLRKIMGITPRHPFEKRPVETLNTWLRLNVIDERIYILETLKPFRDWWKVLRWKSAGLLSMRETLDYIRKRLNNKNDLPIRIDIYYTSSTKAAVEDLHGKIVSLVEEANVQMEAELRTEPRTWTGSGVSPLFIREGTISTLHAGGIRLQRPDGGSKPIVTGVVEPNDLEQHIMWRLTKPKNVPLSFRIEYDETSTALARQTADKVSAIAKDFGISELVDVKRILVETVPESAFLGRWQAITGGDIQTINVQPTGICMFEMSDRFTFRTPKGAIKPGASVPGRWFLTPKEIFMDIKDRRSNCYAVYRGHIDKKGHLIVNSGEILPHGSFHVIEMEQPTVFKKVY